MKKLLATLLLLTLSLTVATPAVAIAEQPIITPSGLTFTEMETQIDTLMNEHVGTSTPGAAIVVVHEGEIIFSRGYGYADIENQIPIDPVTTVFEYGSISKLFIWVTVMQLVEQGLLDLDLDVHNYLPEDLAQQFDFQSSFTMRDLMNHSAGFGEFSFNTLRDAESLNNLTSLRDNLLASQPKQIFIPGTASSYSNFGSALAAYIVGHVVGSEFADFERENIIEPLGMRNTRNQPHWFGDYTFLQATTRGHIPNGAGGFNETPWAYVSMYPTGAVRGTAEDLAKFAIALMPSMYESSPLFYNRNTLDLLIGPSSNSQPLRGTHHGFMTYDGISNAIGHGGSTAGFAAEFVLVPVERFGIVILNNSLHGQIMTTKLLDLVFGNSMDSVMTTYENLPNAESVTGTFVSLRRNVGNILEPWGFMLGMYTEVVAIDDNTIVMGGVTYRQTMPFVFRAVATDDTIIARFNARVAYEIHFTVENGQVTGMSRAGSSYYTIQTFSQSLLAFIIGLSILIISSIFFLIMSVAALIRYWRKKDENPSRFRYAGNCMIITGVLFVINFVILEVRLISAGSFIQSYMVTPHVWINYILFALAIITFILSLMFMKKSEMATMHKIIHFSTSTFLALFVFILWQWNYFVMM